MQSEPYKKQKRRLNVYLTKSRIIYGTNSLVAIYAKARTYFERKY